MLLSLFWDCMILNIQGGGRKSNGPPKSVEPHQVPARLYRNPVAPDWLGDMNPFWQTLDQIFGAHYNSTTNNTKTHYTDFYHPVRGMTCVG